jgi:hypothetical protein
MRIRLASALLVAVLSLGCPFIEELNKSSAEMDKYSRTGQKMAAEKKKAEEEKAKNGGGGFLSAGKKAGTAAQTAKEGAADWWSKATSLNSDERDPDLVKCQLPSGGVEFMRKHDCAMRSGLASK